MRLRHGGGRGIAPVDEPRGRGGLVRAQKRQRKRPRPALALVLGLLACSKPSEPDGGAGRERRATPLAGQTEATPGEAGVQPGMDPSGQAPRITPPSARTRTARAGKPGLRVRSYMPPGSVADQVMGYFDDLGVPVVEHDRFVDRAQAERDEVLLDGTIIVELDARVRKLVVHPQPSRARHSLHRFDAKVGAAIESLGALVHTELLVWADDKDPAGAAPYAQLQRVLEAGGPVHRLPVSAIEADPRSLPEPMDVLVVVDAGRRPLAPAFAAIEAVLARGGSVFAALEPDGSTGLGALGERLGLRFVPHPLVSPRSHVRLRGDASDTMALVTNAFDDHPILEGLRRGKRAAVFAGAGALSAVTAAAASSQCVLWSPPDAFVDVDRSLSQGPDEAAAKQGLLCVSEGAGRTVVTADATWLGDAMLGNASMMSQVLLVQDAVRWAAGIEAAPAGPLEGPGPAGAKADPTLTRYPARSQAAADDAPPWTLAADRVVRVVFDDGTSRVELRPDGDAVRVHVRDEAGERSFVGNAAAQDSLKSVAAPPVYRWLAIGPDAEFGLAPGQGATLTVEAGEEVRRARIGDAGPSGALYIALPGASADAPERLGALRGRWVHRLRQPDSMRARPR